ncbi:MAG: hypothetical protein AAB426_08395 [Myxococcota bacterium]
MSTTQGQPNGPDATRALWLKEVGAKLPLRAEDVFSETRGFFVRRANLARAKLLGRLRPLLEKALTPGESIVYAARAVQYSALESYLGGRWTAYYNNMTALVLTDQRLLLLQIDGKGRPRDIKNQVQLGSVRRASRQGLLGRLFVIELADNTKVRLQLLPSADVKALTKRLTPGGTVAGSAPAGTALEHLCPSCLRIVPGRAGDVAACSHVDCRIPFRSAAKAARLSALVPGVGDLYLRHFSFGAYEFVGSMMLLAIAGYFAMVAAVAQTAAAVTAAATVGALTVLLPRVFDYFVTRHMGRKGLVMLAERPVSGYPTGIARTVGASTGGAGFPQWAYGLFVVGVVGVVGALATLAPTARADGLSQRAQEKASQGDFDAALVALGDAEGTGSLDDNDRARVALALYRAGDMQDGDAVVARLGARAIESTLADDINALAAEQQAAAQSYQEGLEGLVRGDESKAWERIDRALAFHRTIKRPVLPTQRDAVLVSLAGKLLGAPLGRGDYVAARRLAAQIGNQVPVFEVAMLRARMLAFEGKRVEALELLGALSSASPSVGALLLGLETRVALAKTGAAKAEAAAAVRELSRDAMDGSELVRRLALTALAGAIDEEDEDLRAQAAEVARREGWVEAARRLQPEGD